jgi:guanine deaminase
MGNEEFMAMAIDETLQGVRGGQLPFGACIARGERVVSCAHNTVWRDTDPTSHAEMNAIREACRKEGSLDLSGCVLYSTCEPCLMCLGACYRAKLSTLIYAASGEDARRYGIAQPAIPKECVEQLTRSGLQIVGGLLREESQALFEAWRSSGGALPAGSDSRARST